MERVKIKGVKNQNIMGEWKVWGKIKILWGNGRYARQGVQGNVKAKIPQKTESDKKG